MKTKIQRSTCTTERERFSKWCCIQPLYEKWIFAAIVRSSRNVTLTVESFKKLLFIKGSITESNVHTHAFTPGSYLVQIACSVGKCKIIHFLHINEFYNSAEANVRLQQRKLHKVCYFFLKSNTPISFGFFSSQVSTTAWWLNCHFVSLHY